MGDRVVEGGPGAGGMLVGRVGSGRVWLGCSELFWIVTLFRLFRCNRWLCLFV